MSKNVQGGATNYPLVVLDTFVSANKDIGSTKHVIGTRKARDRHYA